MDNLNNQQNNQGDLNFGKLIAMIIGSTIGAGIFTTIGDMAANGAYSGAVCAPAEDLYGSGGL